MWSAIFSLTPTFTQGLLVGQAVILLVLLFTIKFLFLEPIVSLEDDQQRPSRTARSPALRPPIPLARPELASTNGPKTSGDAHVDGAESAEWFNVIVQQAVQAYRQELRAKLSGPDGDEAARVRIENWANARRGTSLFDTIQIHQVDLGNSAPRLSNARVHPPITSSDTPRIQCDVTYTDNISLSLSTSVLFHYPTPSFARLPVSLSLSLSLFSAEVTLTPPSVSDPTLTLKLNPSFTLNLATTSLMGSRAKLSDVPKVHEMIEQRLRRIVAERGEWKVVLPGVRAQDVVDMLERKQS